MDTADETVLALRDRLVTTKARQLTRRSQPPYPWLPEQAQPGVSKPCRTTAKGGQAPRRRMSTRGESRARVTSRSGNSWHGLLLSDPRGRFVSIPRDEPSFIVAPGECDELGA